MKSDQVELDAISLIENQLHVSRETLEALRQFSELVKKWTTRINLVSSGDRERIWSRHICDSLGLIDYVPSSGRWLDIGSGGGFPAIPLAILARERGLGAKLCMVEADGRKAAFLSTVVRELQLDVETVVQRVENLVIAPEGVRLITARALASVDKVLNLVEHLSNDGGQLALLKGRALDAELTDAHKKWHISSQVMRHPLSLEGSILLIQGFKRAHPS